MPGIDDQRAFLPVNVAVLTVSDSRTEADDKSGDLLVNRLQACGHLLVDRKIIPDEFDDIVKQIMVWSADSSIDVVIASGGTGVTGRDVTPEAFESLYDKSIPGFGELFRVISFQKIGTSTIQS